MNDMPKFDEILLLAWRLYSDKVASGLLDPRNEKMMQLQLAQMLQLLAPLYEARSGESYKVLLEHPVRFSDASCIIDIVLEHSLGDVVQQCAIELKCFRRYSGHSQTKKRGAQNLGMYDYWADIERIERYRHERGFAAAYQLTLTDDPYYVDTRHAGAQVATYSTHRDRRGVSGLHSFPVANRAGRVHLRGTYALPWRTQGDFHFIAQRADV